MAMGGDPPWYKPLVSVAASGMNRMMRQEAQASSPIPEDKKRDKVFSFTQHKRVLNLNMMMLSLGSSFSIMDMAHLLKDLKRNSEVRKYCTLVGLDLMHFPPGTMEMFAKK